MILTGTPVLRADFVSSLSWLVSVALISAPLVDYGSDIRWSTALLVATSQLAFVMGFRMSGGRSLVRVGRASVVAEPAKYLAASSALFCLLVVVQAVMQSRVPILGSFRSVAESRQTFFAGEGGGLLRSASTWLQYPTMCFVSMMPVFRRHGRKRYQYLGIVSLICVFDLSLTFGARAGIVFVTISTVSAFVFVYGWPKPTRALFAGLAAVVFIGLFGSAFVNTRNPDFAASPEFFLSRNCAFGEFDDFLENQAPAIQSLALSSCYFSSPVISLDSFISDWDGRWEFRYGQYNAGRLTQSSLAEARSEIAAYNEARGHATNPWATSVRDFWLDFGSFAPLGLLGMGFAFSKLTPRGPIKDSQKVARGALVVPGAFMIPYLSPLILTQVMYPLLSVVLVGVLANAVSSGRRTSPREPAQYEPAGDRELGQSA